MNLRSIFYVNGVFLVMLSMSMILPLTADLYFGYDDWLVFFTCMILTAFFGGCLLLSNIGAPFNLSTRQLFLLTNTLWITISIFGALPFWLSSLKLSFTDSLFESVSGITTTGATIITGLDYTPAGLLLWRAMLQWMGGLWIIFIAISILPFLNVGGMQIFKTDAALNEQFLLRTLRQTKILALLYLALTLICCIGFMVTGLEIFDALAHAMTTISTGGFSTYDASFTHFNNAGAECIAIVFMIIGSLPFIAYFKSMHGNRKAILQDVQVRFFLALIACVIALTALYLTINMNMNFLHALRQASFNVVSILTGTGFTTGNYALWGGFFASFFFVLGVIGGCAGSTSGGIKIFRFQILYEVVKIQIKKLLYPHGVFIAHYSGRAIPENVPMAIMAFFFLYALTFIVLATALSLTGLDFLTPMSGALSTIANVGPGLGDIIGPTGNYERISDTAKWLLSAGMLIGRLELFTVLIMLSPHFWRH